MPELTSTRNRRETDSSHEREERSGTNFHEYQAVAAVVLEISLLGMFLRPVVGPHPIALIYLLGVVLTALFAGRGPCLLAAVMSALFWDFCFLAPIGKLHLDNLEDALTLCTYFIVALFLGQLTTRLRAKEKHERLRERRSTALYQLTGKLAEETDLEHMLQIVVQQTQAAFSAQIALLLANSRGELSYQVHPASTYDITGPEQRVADWAFENGRQAGLFTGNFAHVDTLFLPLTTNGRALGVLGLNFTEPSPLTREQRTLLEAFCQHIGRALGQHRIGTQFERAPYWLDSSPSIRPCST